MSLPPTWRSLASMQLIELLNLWQGVQWSWSSSDIERLVTALGWRVVRQGRNLVQVLTGLNVGGGYASFLLHGGRIARLTVRITDVVEAYQDLQARAFVRDSFSDAVKVVITKLGSPTLYLPGDMPEVRWRLHPVTVRVESLGVVVNLTLAETAYVDWQDECDRILAGWRGRPRVPGMAAPQATQVAQAEEITPSPESLSKGEGDVNRGPQPLDGTMMQKIIPHSQIQDYLKEGYDWVSGYVYRVEDLADLDTPRKLFFGLGLGFSGSSFQSTDSSLHLIRWPAFGDAFYRRPYGGIDEAGMRAIDGWVIERPPFVGNGYAPYLEKPIPQWKVDSIRLPYGATMWRLNADGSLVQVAQYDPDLRWWAPSEEEEEE